MSSDEDRKVDEISTNNNKVIKRDESIKTPIFTSVSKNVQLDVVELLKQVLQWTPLYKPGLNTALIQAAKVGSLGCVKILLSAGAEIDTEDDNGDTPFVHAFRGRHVQVMEHLRELGCNTEIAKMSLALSTKDTAFVKLCHAMEIPVENEDWDAADPAEIKILLDDIGLDPFEGQYGRHGFDDSPFMYVVQEGRPEIVEMMATNHPYKSKYNEKEWAYFIDLAFFKAIRNRRLDNVKLLLASLGAHMEARDGQGRTPFLVACGHDESISKYLMELGADVMAVDNEGLTSLHWAACSGQRIMCSTLMEKGLAVNAKANLGATPLMVACSSRRIEIVELFLTSNSSNIEEADSDATTPEGWTALHVAVRACAPSAILRLLFKCGADPNSRSSTLTHNGDPVPASTPLLIAIALNSLRMVHLLLDANCDIDMPGLVHVDGVWGIKNAGGGGLSSSSPPSFSMSSSESESEDSKKCRLCVPVQFAVASRAWDIAAVLIRAGCKVDAMWSWIEFRKPSTGSSTGGGASLLSLVPLPEERMKQLKQLMWESTSAPLKLKCLCRLVIRKCLGRCDLSDKVDKLEILPPSMRQYLLFHDLFKGFSNSFDV